MGTAMLCKLSLKNQITLPRELLAGCAGTEYFEARREGLRPLESPALSAIRDKVAERGLAESDIPSLVAEARRARCAPWRKSPDC